jgi:hypothetical protein
MASHRNLAVLVALLAVTFIGCGEDDEQAPQPTVKSTVSFRSPSFEGSEAMRSVGVFLVCDDTAGESVSVRCTTSDGSAVAGSDYHGLNQVVTFAPGDTAQTVAIDIIGDDIEEPAETFTVTLVEDAGPVRIGTPGQATVTLLDDD